MSKLLRADVKTLIKWKPTIVTVISMLLLPAVFITMNVINDTPALEGIFMILGVVMMFLTMIIGLFIYRDYSQNTIRNKITVGHKRSSVYFSKVLIISIFELVSVVLFLGSSVLISLLMGKLGGIDWSIFFKNFTVILASYLVIVSITSLLSINIRSAIGAVLPMIFLWAFFFIGTFGLEFATLNDNEAIIDLFRILPVLSITSLESFAPEFIGEQFAISGMTSLLILTLGYFWFKNSDLN